MKIFCIDIDGVLVDRPDTSIYPWNYDIKPIQENIDAVNKLYYSGNYITLYTARGMRTKIDWAEHTNKEMDRLGVKYHELCFGKPPAHYYVDDHMITIEKLREIADESEL